MNFDAPESVSAIKPLSLAGVTDQGVQISEAGLGCHRVAQQAHKTSHIRLSQLQPERRIRRRLAGIVAEQLIEALVVPPGGAFHPHQRSLAAQDREELRQKPAPRQEADAPTHPASRRRLEDKEEITGPSWCGEELGIQGERADATNAIAAATAGEDLPGQMSDRSLAANRQRRLRRSCSS